MAVLLAGASYVWHSAGWGEVGMHCSMAEFVVDAEQCAMGYRFAQVVRWDDIDEGLREFIAGREREIPADGGLNEEY